MNSLLSPTKPRFQEVLKSPLETYEGLYTHEASAQESMLDLEMIKTLIDYKCGRLRQAYKRYHATLSAHGFDPHLSLCDQTHGLNEETAQLVLFELIFHMIEMAPNWDVDINRYIDVLDHFGPADRVVHGALYNILLSFSIRKGTHAVARQFAAMALGEYQAAHAPYLEGFIHLHLALLHMADAQYDNAKTHCIEAARLFGAVRKTDVEKAHVEIIEAWIEMETSGTIPEEDRLERIKTTILSGELWGEMFLILATVLFRAKTARGQEDLLDTHSALETILRVRRMTSLLPAMQLMRDEYFATGTSTPPKAQPAELDEFQLLLLQPTRITFSLNYGPKVPTRPLTLPRLKALHDLRCGFDALKERQFARAADHFWPALDVIEEHGIWAVLRSEAATLTEFARQCRQRRRFVERAKALRQRLFDIAPPRAPMTEQPKELTATEYRILTLLLDATSNKAMARTLDVSEPTIKFHLANIYRKLNVHSRRDAIKAAAARGWIHLQGNDA